MCSLYNIDNCFDGFVTYSDIFIKFPQVETVIHREVSVLMTVAGQLAFSTTLLKVSSSTMLVEAPVSMVMLISTLRMWNMSISTFMAFRADEF